MTSGSGDPVIFPSNGSIIRRPLSSTGSCGSVPRLHRYYGALRLPKCPSRRTSLPSPGGTTLASVLRSQEPRTSNAHGPGVVDRVLLPGIEVEASGSPRFLGNPLWTCHALRPRRDLHARPLRHFGAAFRFSNGVGSRERFTFRGSITRPAHSLFTLRSPDCSGTTQNSLPAAGQLYRAGLATRWVPIQGFKLFGYSPCPGLSWRTRRMNGTPDCP